MKIVEIVLSGTIAYGVVFLFYWLFGGNFERGWILGAVSVVGLFLWGYLLTLKMAEDPTPKKHDV